jgi:hypothetical protein
MFLHHPDLLLTQVRDYQRELVAEADQRRLLNAARRRRRALASADAEATRAARARPAGTVVPCGPAAAAPAR